MALDFPINPVIDQTYVDDNGQAWIFNGYGWERTEPIVSSNVLDDLDDVDTVITPPVTNYILRYNGAIWIPSTMLTDYISDIDLTSITTDQLVKWSGTALVPFTPNLNTLSNVNVANPLDDQLLQFNSSSGNWENITYTVALSNLTDVDVTTTPPNDGEALAWNNTSGKWEPSAAGTGDVIAANYNNFTNAWNKFSNAAANIGFDNEDAPDGYPFKRITSNDGGGNWNFRAGSYYNSGELYAVTGDSATHIQFTCESSAGRIILRAAPTGTAGASVTYSDLIDILAGTGVTLTSAAGSVDLDAPTTNWNGVLTFNGTDGDKKISMTASSAAISAVVMTNNESTAFSEENGLLLYDNNFYSDAGYGNEVTDYFSTDGGGLVQYMSEGGGFWAAYLNTHNMLYCTPSFEGLVITGTTCTVNGSQVLTTASGALLDSDFTANGTMERTGAGSYTTILNKRDATTAPTTTDDTNSGYSVGSRWIDVTNDKEYVCLDATASAAVWTETTGSGGTGSAVTVVDETTTLTTDVKKLTFTGAGVTATEPVADEITITIPGGSGGSSVWYSATAPTDTTTYKFWFDTDDGILRVFYDDGDSTQWIDVASNLSASINEQPNELPNGDFDVWQRGTSFSIAVDGTDHYTADKVWLWSNGTNTVTTTRQTFTLGQTDVPDFPRYYTDVNMTAIDSGSTGLIALQYNVEDVQTLAGETVTISFYAKTDTGTRDIAVTARQNFGNGGSPSSTTNTLFGKFELNTTWKKYTATITVPSMSGKTLGTDSPNYSALKLTWYLSAGSSYDSDTDTLGTQSTGHVYLSHIKLEKGSVATKFNKPREDEIYNYCFRYYWYINEPRWGASGYATAASQTEHCTTSLAFPVKMYTGPTSDFSGATVAYGNISSIDSVNSIDGCRIRGTTVAAGSCYWYISSGYITFDSGF